MSIYFDNSATTKICDEALAAVNKYSSEVYANPSSMHRFGFIVEKDVNDATNVVADIIGCKSDEIIWTSGGSESNNLSVDGYVKANIKRGKHIITTNIEHPSVLKVFNKLETEGMKVSYLKVDSNGIINIDELIDLINDETILVSIMYVNNEIGSVQKIDEIGKRIKEKNKDTAFHVDFVQGFGKYNINVKNSKIDFLSISSHKIHGPKGVGILYKNKSLRIAPCILGGGQQNNLRAGTLNVPGIIGTVEACKVCYQNLKTESEKLIKIKDLCIKKLTELNKKYGIIYINSKNDENFVPHILSVSFLGIRAEVMLHALDEKEIYVSAGSACSSHDKKVNSTLINIGLPLNRAESTIRLSFGRYNKLEEVDEFIDALDTILPKLLITKR